MRGGVEVFLRVGEAKTKKNAILWAPNVTVVPARGGDAHKVIVFLLYGKVTPLSITEYIFLSTTCWSREGGSLVHFGI